MAWNYEGFGTQAQVLAGITAMQPGINTNDAAVLPTAQTQATTMVNQFASLNAFPALHVVVRGHAGKSTFRNDCIVEAVQLDARGNWVGKDAQQIA
jgi:hypothetical protein